jgi:starch synthase
MAPVSKVGGLADVVFGLSQETAIRGHEVEIVLPKYDNMRYDHIYGLCESYRDLWVPWFGGAVHCTVFFGFVHGRKCFFIDPHSQDNFFNRGKFYGEHDDVLRFAFFSRAAMEFLLKSGKRPDIIHCHDWATGLVPVFLFEIYQHIGMGNCRVCYTIHNFRHQGVCGSELLAPTGLNRPDYYLHHDRLGDPRHPGALNLMKGGIVYANFVTTVSPTHAGEARDLGQGFGLEHALHTHHAKYGGVINGIDYEVWNPATDGHIAQRYHAGAVEKKYENKRALRRRLLLADNEKPVVASIGRLDPQKGLELVRHALFFCVNNGAQFVLLGSSPEPAIDAFFWHLKNEINDNPDCHIEVGFDEELAHLIYAGADMVLVPSRYEPCGLTQMIAMRYGAIPVVRAVGGLADTVFDKDFSAKPLHERNGYVFHNDDYAGVESALSRAISCYYQYPEHFRHLMLNAMEADYSWNVPGQHYLNIYNHIRSK